MIFLIILAGLAIMLASLAGVIFTNKTFGNWLQTNLTLLVSLAAGTFAFLVYSLSIESVELLGGNTALLLIFGSFIVSWVGFKLIPFFHHHHIDDGDHGHNPGEGRKILVADGIHNIGDGFVLVAAFMISTPLGWVTAGGIFLHEFVQELSEYVVLRKAGYTNRQALIRNFAVSGTILIGIVIALLLSQLAVEGYLLAITAGLFMSIVLQDLLPETIEKAKQPGKLLPYASAFVIGLAIMAGLAMAAGHTHSHGDDHEHHDDEHSGYEHGDEHGELISQ